MVHSHLYLMREDDDPDDEWDLAKMNDDEAAIMFGKGGEELEIKLIKIIYGNVSLVNNMGYFLLEFNEDGILCEPGVRSEIYDLDDGCLRIIGVDEI